MQSLQSSMLLALTTHTAFSRLHISFSSFSTMFHQAALSSHTATRVLSPCSMRYHHVYNAMLHCVPSVPRLVEAGVAVAILPCQ